MSFLSRVRSALALPAAASGDVRFLSPYDDVNHLWPIIAPDWLPSHGLTRSAAIRIPAVARARKVICTSIARMPLRAYKGDDLLADPLLWLDRTDGPVSPYHRMLWTVDDLLFYGVSLWALERNTDGTVRAADRVPFDDWYVDELHRVVYRRPDGNDVVADEREVVVIPGSDDGILCDGVDALTHARDLLRAASRAAETPAAYLELHQTNDVPVPEDKVKAMIARWAEARRGENGGVAFTSSGVELREHGSFDKHLLVEGRNAAALDVARAVGIPGSIVDANNGADLTYENAQDKARDLIDYGLAAYMSPISARLGMDDVVPRGIRIAFELEQWIGPGNSAGTPDDGGSSTGSPTPTTPEEPR